MTPATAEHQDTTGTLRRFLILFSLIFAGEAIFSLPFHLPRFFRPTMLDVLDFSNTQLGDVFAAYGLIAMLSYFPGGPIADRFTPRTLISLSLIATALGGLYMATFPGAGGMTVLYAFWGFTTIFLFWAPLIRATRRWGGHLAQGQAFGLLDGGRGLVAAGSATVAVVYFSWFLPADVMATSESERSAGFSAVVYLYTGLTLAAALFTWLFLPRALPPGDGNHLSARNDIMQVIRRPYTWAIAGIVICAYCGYKALDNYGLYAVQVLGMNELEAARFTSNAAYLRVVGAIGAGFMADRFSPSRVITACFVLAAGSYLFLSIAAPATWPLGFIYANLLMTFLLVYSLRGVYFALLEETGAPSRLTGATAGVVSTLGFTPEIFFYPIAGRLLDMAPGITGHHYYFALLATFAIAGALITISVIISQAKVDPDKAVSSTSGT